MLEQLKKLHFIVEHFFEARRREATLGRALVLWLFFSLFIGVGVIVSDYSFDSDLLFLALNSSFASVVKSFLWKSLFISIIFLVASVVFYLLGEILFKGKGSFSQVAYCYLIPIAGGYAVIFASIFVSLLISLFFSGNALISAITALALLIIIFLSSIISVYAFFVALKTAHRISYARVIGLLVMGNLIGGFVWYLLLLAIVQTILLIPTTNSTATLTNNLDGSITMAYNNTNGICVLAFPSGWMPASTEETEIELKGGYPFKNNTKYRVFYGANKSEKLFFDWGTPPWSYGPDAVSSACELWNESTSTTRKLNLSGFQLDSYSLKRVRNKEIEVCDAKFVNSKTNEIFHDVELRFYNGLGFEFEYSSKTGNDSSMYYILEKMECTPKS